MIDSVRNFTQEVYYNPMTECIGTIDGLPFQYFLSGTHTKAEAEALISADRAKEIAEGRIDYTLKAEYTAAITALNTIMSENDTLQASTITTMAQAVTALKRIGNGVDKLAEIQKKILIYIKKTK
jgi:hypothetical protein